MPPIPSSRNSPSFRKKSTSGGQDGFHPNTPSGKELDQNNNEEYGLKVVGEIGYLPVNSRKKSTAEKLSDTGFHLYTLHDSNKLPKIIKPKKKVSKGSKRKKTTAMNDESQESQDDNMSPRLEAIEGNKTTSDVSSAGEDNEEFNNKYGLDFKREFSESVHFCSCHITIFSIFTSQNM